MVIIFRYNYMDPPEELFCSIIPCITFFFIWKSVTINSERMHS